MAESEPASRAEARLRVFFALWPDAVTAAALHAHGRHLHARCGGRVMRRDTLHLTLAFLGDVPASSLEVLGRLAARLKGEAFDLVLDRSGSWQKNRIVWLAPASMPAALAALVKALGDALAAAGFSVEARPFAPHVTLLRNSHAAPPEDVSVPLLWRVGGFALVASERRSEGARYRVVGRWRFARSRAGVAPGKRGMDPTGSERRT